MKRCYLRQLIPIVILIFLVSCADTSGNQKEADVPERSKEVLCVLKDSLGAISIILPLRFDTFFSWTNQSDCGKSCEREMYRYQPKSLPVFKESGFYYRAPDIEKDQFTILHSGYFPFHDGTDTSKNKARHENFKERLLTKEFYDSIVFDTIERIYDRYYSIISLTGYDTSKHKYSAKLAALTTIKSNAIEFHFDTVSKRPVNQTVFFNDAIKCIRTIRIDNGI